MRQSKSKSRPPLFDRLKQGLEESIDYTRGKVDLRSTEIPDAPPEVTASDIVALRKRMAVSQAVFAQLLNVSTKTIQSWEQGLRKPSQSSLRLLQIVDRDPGRVLEIVSSAGALRPGASRRPPSA